ncbi:unnamed protein product [Cuscuta epithymum]|uniref:Uncharacterized protein n=1 Tax=Cuscuta epithymum TaxID=186058 RepID=A0AAV0F0P4_9ASTE|nr:unnamed protein product [Cuscuta epithymum]
MAADQNRLRTCVVMGGQGLIGASPDGRPLSLGNWIVRVSGSALPLHELDLESVWLLSPDTSDHCIDVRCTAQIANDHLKWNVDYCQAVYLDISNIEGKAQEGKAEEGKAQEGKAEEGNEEGKAAEGNEEGKAAEGNEEGKSAKGNEEGKAAEGNEEGKAAEGNSEEGNAEGKGEGGNAGGNAEGGNAGGNSEEEGNGEGDENGEDSDKSEGEGDSGEEEPRKLICRKIITAYEEQTGSIEIPTALGRAITVQPNEAMNIYLVKGGTQGKALKVRRRSDGRVFSEKESTLDASLFLEFFEGTEILFYERPTDDANWFDVKISKRSTPSTSE